MLGSGLHAIKEKFPIFAGAQNYLLLVRVLVNKNFLKEITCSEEEDKPTHVRV